VTLGIIFFKYKKFSFLNAQFTLTIFMPLLTWRCYVKTR